MQSYRRKYNQQSYTCIVYVVHDYIIAVKTVQEQKLCICGEILQLTYHARKVGICVQGCNTSKHTDGLKDRRSNYIESYSYREEGKNLDT